MVVARQLLPNMQKRLSQFVSFMFYNEINLLRCKFRFSFDPILNVKESFKLLTALRLSPSCFALNFQACPSLCGACPMT